MTSLKLFTFPKLFVMPCQLPANLQTCTSRQTTRSRTHYLWGGTPCEAKFHYRLQHVFKTPSTTTSGCWLNQRQRFGIEPRIKNDIHE